MRIPVMPLLFAVALCACSPQTPEPTPTPAPERTPAATSAPVATQTVAKEIPQGTCGDQSKVAPEQRVANTARWTTASEQDNFGFDVYRGDSEKGTFTKLTKDPIVGAGTSDETHKYEFRDDTIDPCMDYWYYVEGISTSGSREKFTPTFRAPAKRRAVATAPDADHSAPPPASVEPAKP